MKILSILTRDVTGGPESKREATSSYDPLNPAGLPKPKKTPKPYEAEIGPTEEDEAAEAEEKAKKKAKKAKRKLRPMDPGPTLLRRAKVIVDKALVRGVGGLTFTAQAPPGPARLMRLPFYPANDNDAFNGSAGIDTAGDDPILRVTLQNTTAGVTSVTSTPVRVLTPIVDYGRYKVVGIQVNYQYNYAPKDALGAFAPPYAGFPAPNPNAQVGQVGIAAKNLQVYNGQQLFIVNQNSFLDAEELRALPTLGSSGFTGGAGGFGSARYQGQRPWQTSAFRQQFVGLRDYPVIDEVAQVTLEFQVFTRSLAPGFSIVVPITACLVVEMLEDRVFGNILNPSPAARAGANVKVGIKDIGKKDDREQLEIRSLRYQREK